VITICFLCAPLMESQQVAGEHVCMPTDSHFPAALVPEGSSPCLQKTTIGSCPDQVKRTWYLHKLFVWAGFEAMKFLSSWMWYRIVWRMLLTFVGSSYFHRTMRHAVSVFRVLWRWIPPEYPVPRPRKQLSDKKWVYLKFSWVSFLLSIRPWILLRTPPPLLRAAY
jgi:hypothetical protein